MNTTFANHHRQQTRLAERRRRLAELEAAYEAAVTANTRSFHRRMESVASDHLLLADADAGDGGGEGAVTGTGTGATCTGTNAGNENIAPRSKGGTGREEGGCPTWLGIGEAPTAEECSRGYMYMHVGGFAARVATRIQQNRLNTALAVMVLVSIAGIIAAFVTPSANDNNSSWPSPIGTGPTNSLIPIAGRAPPISRRDYIHSIIVQSNVSPLDLLDNDDFPQGRAFTWLLDDDAFALHMYGNTEGEDRRHYKAETGMDWHPAVEQQAVLLRYSLAVLFYATSSTAMSAYDVETAVIEPEQQECIWNRNDRWLSGQSICTWYGVTCSGLFDESGRTLPESSSSSLPIILDNSNPILLSINLTSNNLAGSLPSELFSGLGSSLQLLDLSWNDLSSTLPTEIGHASGLHRLDLTANEHLTGSLPATISLISHLQYLLLDGCSLTGTIPPKLKHLTRLQMATFPSSIVGEK